ncbi:MAG: aldehyde-activating protein [Erythrobacter sp.]|nr:aldehyde-activating protein [Erythrobacter sp.]MBA4042770.1 aldehyde-activating protein [Sphingobium sp.]MBA4081368.1 aldehyde-activating protein [Erythrobacter sp.]
MPTGRCHCGACVYAFDNAPTRAAVCHCSDCRRCAGAHGVGWAAVPSGAFRLVEGETAIYRSSPGTERHFCGACGTGLYYINEEVLPGIVDIQLATLDDPEAFPPEALIQMADAPAWVETLHTLPKFERFPGG